MGNTYNSLTYNDIAKGIFTMEDPIYMLDENGAAVEFLASASNDIYEEFTRRTPLLDESRYDDFADLMTSDDYLDIYIIARENNAIKVVIGLHNGEGYHLVPLSNSEQNDLYTFVSQFCSGHIGQSLDDMLEEAKEDKVESLLEPVYGKGFVEELKSKVKASEDRCDIER